jgi:hypothetical protein
MSLLAYYRQRRDVKRQLRRLDFFLRAALTPPTDPRGGLFTTQDLPTVSIEQGKKIKKLPRKGKK